MYMEISLKSHNLKVPLGTEIIAHQAKYQSMVLLLGESCCHSREACVFWQRGDAR